MPSFIGLGLTVADPSQRDSNLLILNRPQILMGMAITAVVLMAIAHFIQWLSGTALLGWQWHPGMALVGLGLGGAITLASIALYFIWPAYQASAELYLHMVLDPLFLPDVLWLGLLPGLSEELLFRGVLLPALGGGAIAVGVSGLCFGVSHMSGKSQWPYALWASIVGIILGSATLATGNLLVPVLAHITTNVLSATFWKFAHRRRADQQP